MNRRTLVAGTAAGLVAALGGCLSRAALSGGTERRTDERRYAVDPGTVLSVDNRNGEVIVGGHDGDEVRVDIEIEAPSKEAVNAVSVEAERSDGDLRLVTSAEYSFPDRASVSLSVACPTSVSVDGIGTSNGPVEVTDVAGDVTVESSNGGITARGVRGTVSLSTSNGGITARGIGGLAGARTANGSIEVDVPAIDRDVEVRTENGGIDAALGTDLDAAVTASTTNGSVELHGVDLADAETGDSRVSGTLGDGAHGLTFETRNSGIDLRVLGN